MEQLSRPYQIALGAILVLALAWFTVLKPSDGESAAPSPAASTPGAPSGPTAPGVAGLGRAVDKADGAASQSDASAKATQDAAAAAAEGSAAPSAGAGPAAGSAPSAPAPTSGAASPDSGLEPGDASRPILQDLKADKVAVVLFYNPLGADDRAVRRALKGVSRFKGKVRVRQVPISRVADYPAITQGVPVTQAPTILVMNRTQQARRLVGYQDTTSIEQLVRDVGGRRFRPSGEQTYVARVETLCEATRTETATLPGSGPAFSDDAVTRVRSQFASALKSARGLEVPRGYSRFQSAFEESLELNLRAHRSAVKAERADGTGAAVLKRASPRITRQGDALERQARAKGIEGC